MAAIVFLNQGIIDKYLGDGLLAFFENEKEKVISAENAIQTAIQMQTAARELNSQWAQKIRFDLHIRIGISTGYAAVGNIGPKEKFDYTIIGSKVNMASRLQSIGGEGDIIFDEDTHSYIKDRYNTRNLGEVELKGFEHSIKAFKLVSAT